MWIVCSDYSRGCGIDSTDNPLLKFLAVNKFVRYGVNAICYLEQMFDVINLSGLLINFPSLLGHVTCGVFGMIYQFLRALLC